MINPLPRELILGYVNLVTGHLDIVFHDELEQLTMEHSVAFSGEPFFAARKPMVQKFSSLSKLQYFKLM